MPPRKKFEWSKLTFLAPFVLAVIGWGISVEVRMSTSNALIDTKVAKMDSALSCSERIKNIEDLMLPLLVDWKVNQEIKRLKKEGRIIPTPVPEKSTDVEKSAQHWAESKMEQFRKEEK